MTTDPVEYATRLSGPVAIGLRLPSVADDLADDMRDRRESMIQAKDRRGRIWHHSEGKPSRRISPAQAGTMLRRRFLEVTKLHIGGDAASSKTWRMLAEMVCEIFRSECTKTIDGWVMTHIVASPGYWIRRDRLLALLLTEIPGHENVRGRELAQSLVEHGFAGSQITRRSEDGVQHRTWENIKYIAQQETQNTKHETETKESTAVLS